MQKLKQDTLCAYCKSFSGDIFEEYIIGSAHVQNEDVCIDAKKLSSFLSPDRYFCWRQNLCCGTTSSDFAEIKFHGQALCQTYVCKEFDPLPTSPSDIRHSIFKAALEKDSVLRHLYENYPKLFECYLMHK